MPKSAKPHATGKVKPGDVKQRVGVEQIASRGVDVNQLIEKLIDAAGAEFTTYYITTTQFFACISRGTKITRKSAKMRAWKTARILS